MTRLERLHAHVNVGTTWRCRRSRAGHDQGGPVAWPGRGADCRRTVRRRSLRLPRRLQGLSRRRAHPSQLRAGLGIVRLAGLQPCILTHARPQEASELKSCALAQCRHQYGPPG
jgi:hypothetical protein